MPSQKTVKFFSGVGRRKTATASVRLSSGKGAVLLDENEMKEPSPVFLAPLKLVGELGKWDISAHTAGGGMSSKVEAIRLGVARALLKINPDLKKTLRTAGFLTRDPREKERKKPGLKRARRAPQWSKR